MPRFLAAKLCLLIAGAALVPSTARADEPPAPPAAPSSAPIDPGMDDEAPPNIRATRPIVAPSRRPRPSEATPPSPQAVEARRAEGRDPIEDVIVRAQKGVTLGTLVDELVEELAAQIAKEDPKPFSPLAVRLVRLSPNLRPEMAQAIESKIVARLGKVPNLEQVICIECRAIRSRVEGNDWVVTLGATTQEELSRIGRSIGARAFLEVDVDFQQVPAELTLSAKIYRASDAHVLYTAALRGDETTAAILRSGERPISKEEQLAELKRKLEMRPYYGYMAFLGGMYIQADGAQGGYAGFNLGVRLFERFGSERRHMFGLQAEGMLDFGKNHELYAGMLSGGYWFSLMPRTYLNWGDLRVGATAGGFIAGNEGNSVLFQVMAEYVLQFRLTASLGALYMVPTPYAGANLGGFGATARAAMSW